MLHNFTEILIAVGGTPVWTIRMRDLPSLGYLVVEPSAIDLIAPKFCYCEPAHPIGSGLLRGPQPIVHADPEPNCFLSDTECWMISVLCFAACFTDSLLNADCISHIPSPFS